MSQSILTALAMYALAGVIAMGVALLIKGLFFVVRRFGGGD